MWSRAQSLICLIRAGDEAIAPLEPPLILSDGDTWDFLPLSQTEKWKQENPYFIYPISAVQIIFMGQNVVYALLSSFEHQVGHYTSWTSIMMKEQTNMDLTTEDSRAKMLSTNAYNHHLRVNEREIMNPTVRAVD